LVIAEPFDNYEHPAWWLTCPRCHGRMFATTEMIEQDNVPACKECAIKAATYARTKARNREAEDMIAAGREREPEYEKLIEEERKEQDAQMLKARTVMTDELKHIDCGEIDEAAAFKTYCETYVSCAGCKKHRPKADEDKPCPACGCIVPRLVEAYPNVA